MYTFLSPTVHVQYAFTVPKDSGEVMVSLMQKDVRDQKELKADKGGKAAKKEMPDQNNNFSIGYYIMRVGKV